MGELKDLYELQDRRIRGLKSCGEVLNPDKWNIIRAVLFDDTSLLREKLLCAACDMTQSCNNNMVGNMDEFILQYFTKFLSDVTPNSANYKVSLRRPTVNEYRVFILDEIDSELFMSVRYTVHSDKICVTVPDYDILSEICVRAAFGDTKTQVISLLALGKIFTLSDYTFSNPDVRNHIRGLFSQFGKFTIEDLRCFVPSMQILQGCDNFSKSLFGNTIFLSIGSAVYKDIIQVQDELSELKDYLFVLVDAHVYVNTSCIAKHLLEMKGNAVLRIYNMDPLWNVEYRGAVDHIDVKCTHSETGESLGAILSRDLNFTFIDPLLLKYLIYQLAADKCEDRYRAYLLLAYLYRSSKDYTDVFQLLRDTNILNYMKEHNLGYSKDCLLSCISEADVKFLEKFHVTDTDVERVLKAIFGDDANDIL